MIAFSLLHATRGRPQKAAAAMRMWLERAANPAAIEYILCADESDETRFDLLKATNPLPTCGQHIYVEHLGSGSAPAWDWAAACSRGEILVQVSDDIEPPHNWDVALWGCLVDRNWSAPCVIAVSDGFRKDALQTIAICTRPRYKQVGHFIFPGYHSVYSDDDFTINAIADAADGKCELIDARHLPFLHRHHYHDKAVPMDDTYARGNSAEAYAAGQALFMQRNAHLVARGLKTW